MWSRCESSLASQYGGSPGAESVKSCAGRDAEVNLCSGTGCALDVELGTDLGRTFAHPAQPPVTLPARFEHVGVNANAVITDEQAEVMPRVSNERIHAGGP